MFTFRDQFCTAAVYPSRYPSRTKTEHFTNAQRVERMGFSWRDHVPKTQYLREQEFHVYSLKAETPRFLYYILCMDSSRIPKGHSPWRTVTMTVQEKTSSSVISGLLCHGHKHLGNFWHGLIHTETGRAGGLLHFKESPDTAGFPQENN